MPGENNSSRSRIRERRRNRRSRARANRQARQRSNSDSNSSRLNRGTDASDGNNADSASEEHHPLPHRLHDGSVANVLNQWYSRDHTRPDRRHPSASPRASRPLLSYAEYMRPISLDAAAAGESGSDGHHDSTNAEPEESVTARNSSSTGNAISLQLNNRLREQRRRRRSVYDRLSHSSMRNRTRENPLRDRTLGTTNGARDSWSFQPASFDFHRDRRNILDESLVDDDDDMEDEVLANDGWVVDGVQVGGPSGSLSVTDVPSWFDILLPHHARERCDKKPSITINSAPDSIVSSSVSALARLDPSVIFDGKVSVHYLDPLKGNGAVQTGSDAGGVFRDWLSRVSVQLFDPAAPQPLVVQAATAGLDGTRPLLIAPHHEDREGSLDRFRLMGQVIGFALKNDLPLGADLSPPFCRAILGPNVAGSEDRIVASHESSSSSDTSSTGSSENGETSQRHRNSTQSYMQHDNRFDSSDTQFSKVLPGFRDLQYLIPEKYEVLRVCRDACAAVREWHQKKQSDKPVDFEKASREVPLCADIYATEREVRPAKFGGKPITPLECVLETLSFEALTHKSLLEELQITPEVTPHDENQETQLDSTKSSKRVKKKKHKSSHRTALGDARSSSNTENDAEIEPTPSSRRKRKRVDGDTSTHKRKTPKTQPMFHHGEHVPVTVYSFEAYLKLLIQHLLIDNTSDAARCILMGICEVRTGAQLIRKLSVAQLRRKIAGEPTVGVSDWKRNSEVEFEGVSNPNSIQESTEQQQCKKSMAEKSVKWFWRYVRSLDSNERSDLFFWLNGQRRLPHGGMKSAGITQRLLVRANVSIDRLPVAHTCSNTLELSLYSNFKMLQKRFKLAIQTARFDIA